MPQTQILQQLGTARYVCVCYFPTSSNTPHKMVFRCLVVVEKLVAGLGVCIIIGMAGRILLPSLPFSCTTVNPLSCIYKVVPEEGIQAIHTCTKEPWSGSCCSEEKISLTASRIDKPRSFAGGVVSLLKNTRYFARSLSFPVSRKKRYRLQIPDD